jgi:CDP-diacylglycerol--serine O-phosphatidyltransferase
MATVRPPRSARRRLRRTVVRFRGLTLNRLLPNILTVLALCAGLTAVYFAVHGKWELAVIAVMVAAVVDGLDGRVARLLKGSSQFGAELDSLADIVSFGVAPALVLYLWILQDTGRFGWIVVMAYVVSAALRLARFNTGIGDETLPPFAYNYFQGVPMPAGALLALMPLMLSFELPGGFWLAPALVAGWVLLVACLMISRIPTFSMKGLRIPQEYIVPVLVGVATVAAMLVTMPWPTLAALGLVYLGSMPFSVRRYAHLKRQAAMMKGEIAILPAGELPGDGRAA